MIVPLRGADPYLRDCLLGLLRQNYPCYGVRIIVDSDVDPAWNVIQSIVDETRVSDVIVSVLDTVRDTCSLKASATVQALEELDESYETVVTLDADVVPYANWLKDLVSPLIDPRIGAASGILWYMPQSRDMATLVRYVWNAAALPVMFVLGIPWGGSLAIKREVLCNTDMVDRWRRSLVDDVPVYGVLREADLRLDFVPNAVVLNREVTSRSSLRNFLHRQLLAVLLYHRGWPVIVADTVISTATIVLCFITVLISVFAQEWTALAWAFAGWFIYASVMGLLLVWLELHVRRIVRARGKTISPLPWRLVLAGSKVLRYTLIGITCAIFRKRVRWRGIDYEILGVWGVRRLNYEPFLSAETNDAPVSL